jgi:hypothetical protein
LARGNFIAVHNNGDQMLKIQLKERFTIDKKYKEKEIYIAFVEKDEINIFYHDDAISLLPKKCS